MSAEAWTTVEADGSSADEAIENLYEKVDRDWPEWQLDSTIHVKRINAIAWHARVDLRREVWTKSPGVATDG